MLPMQKVSMFVGFGSLGFLRMEVSRLVCVSGTYGWPVPDVCKTRASSSAFASSSGLVFALASLPGFLRSNTTSLPSQ